MLPSLNNTYLPAKMRRLARRARVIVKGTPMKKDTWPRGNRVAEAGRRVKSQTIKVR